MRHLDLFSGIGGFALGGRMAGGYRTIGFCEREPFCQKVLAKNFPNVPIFNDIHELKGTDHGRIDIITGGFPCQPFSVAGKQGGQKDDRYLWPEMLRVIEQARPTWVLGENVPGIIGLGLDQVLSDLEGIGYTARTFIIPACALDAPHRRDRVWILAHAIEPASGHDVENSNDSRRKRGGGPVQQPGGCPAIGPGETMANANEPGLEIREECPGLREQSAVERGSLPRAPRFPKSSLGGGIDGLSGWLDRYWGEDWEEGIPRVTEPGANRTNRLKGLGNAIVPQVAAVIMAGILEVMEV